MEALGEDVQPVDGDYSLCAYCCEWGIFRGGQIVMPTPAEATVIANNRGCQTIRDRFIAFKATRTGGRDSG